MDFDLAPIAFFSTVVLIVYFAIRASLQRRAMDYDHSERMYGAERGIPDLITAKTHLSGLSGSDKPKRPYLAPFILGFVGFGLFLAHLISWDFDMVAVSLMLLFAGAGWTIAIKLSTQKPSEQG